MPSNQNSGNWAWDIPGNLGSFIESTGSRWSAVFCPGTAPRFTDADNFSLYNYGLPTFRVTGYANTIAYTASVSPTNWNPTLTLQSIQNGATLLSAQPPAERVLLADATISAPNQNNMTFAETYNWTDVLGGYAKGHLSPHLSSRPSSKLPLGGNLGMLDGHVEWRKFPDMHPRTTGGSPVFWW